MVLPVHLPRPEHPGGGPFWVSGLAILALLVWVNLEGTEESSQFQIVVTALKVALIALFLSGGLQALEPGTVTTSMAENITSLPEIGLTSALVFVTFYGSSAIATNAEEIQSPGRTVPRAIYFSMGFVTFVHALVVQGARGARHCWSWRRPNRCVVEECSR